LTCSISDLLKNLFVPLLNLLQNLFLVLQEFGPFVIFISFLHMKLIEIA